MFKLFTRSFFCKTQQFCTLIKINCSRSNTSVTFHDKELAFKPSKNSEEKYTLLDHTQISQTTTDNKSWEGCTNISDYCAFITQHSKQHPCTVLGPPAPPLSMLEPHLTILSDLDSQKFNIEEGRGGEPQKIPTFPTLLSVVV